MRGRKPERPSGSKPRGKRPEAVSIRKNLDRRSHREWRYSPGLSRGLLPIQRRLAPAAGGSPTGPQGGAPWDPKGKDRAASDPNQKIEKSKTTKNTNNVIENQKLTELIQGNYFFNYILVIVGKYFIYTDFV